MFININLNSISATTFKAMTGIHITEKHSDKMEGLQSISTSCILNPFCQARRKIQGSICEKCYAHNMLAYRKNMNPCLEKNYQILTTQVVDESILPTIHAPAFRFQAFGDVFNWQEMKNYINLANKNSNVPTAIWSKNWNVVERSFAMFGKPQNMQYVYSWEEIDGNIEDMYAWLDNHPFANKVFAVFTADYLIKNNIRMNCAKKCINCLKCYNPNNHDRIIIEVLKSDEKKYYKWLENQAA